MPDKAELYSIFASYPSKEHVQKFCKIGHGATTCRYLARRGTDFRCVKAVVSLKESLDKKVQEGSLGPQGDNCPGTLGFIIDKQKLLLGHTTIHHEAGKVTEGKFEGIEIIYGLVGVGGFSMTEKETQVAITPEGITFTAAAHPNLGSETILFEEPQKYSVI